MPSGRVLRFIIPLKNGNQTGENWKYKRPSNFVGGVRKDENYKVESLIYSGNIAEGSLLGSAGPHAVYAAESVLIERHISDALAVSTLLVLEVIIRSVSIAHHSGKRQADDRQPDLHLGYRRHRE